MKIFIQLLLNFFLLFSLLVLLVTPVAVGELMVANPFSGTNGQVAGVQTKKAIAVYPNFLDFNGFVGFELKTNPAGELIDNLKLTSFRAQIARYQNLYEIYNNTAKPLKLSIVVDEQEFNPVFQSLILTLKTPVQAGFTTLENDTTVGSTFLEVKNPLVFSQEFNYVVAGETVIQAVDFNSQGIVTLPQEEFLAKDLPIYPQSIFIQDGKVWLSVTQTITLPPKQKVSVDVIVKGKLDGLTPTNQIDLPIVFKVAPVK